MSRKRPGLQESLKVTRKRVCPALVGADCEAAQLSPLDESALPEELLLHILSFLDYKALMECTKLDKRINQLICVTCPKLTLTIKDYGLDYFKEILISERRFKKITIKGIRKRYWHAYLMEGLERIGYNAKELEFEKCEFSSRVCSKLFSCFPKVKKLTVSTVKIFGGDDDFELLDNFKHLEHIVEYDCDNKLLKHLPPPSKTLQNLACYKIMCSIKHAFVAKSSFLKDSFKGLNSITIKSLDSPVNWTQLAADNPKLTCVYLMNQLPRRSFCFQSFITQMKQMKLLCLGNGFVFTSRELHIIKKIPKLKSLVMLKTAWMLPDCPETELEGIQRKTLKVFFIDSLPDHTRNALKRWDENFPVRFDRFR